MIKTMVINTNASREAQPFPKLIVRQSNEKN